MSKEELVSRETTSHSPGMLGNFSAEERLKEHDKSASQKRAVIAICVSFEESRLAATCLATAYEQIMPLRRRGVASRVVVQRERTRA